MSERKSASLVSSIMLITLIGKIMGLIRDRMQAITFGADTAESIAFAQASILPRNFLDIMLSAAFSASFIPVFNSYMETKGKKEAFTLASFFISVVAVITAIVTVIGLVFAGPIFSMSLGSTALPDGVAELGPVLLRIMFPLIIISGLAFSFTGVLQSLGKFTAPAAMGIASNSVILIYYFFFIDRFGVYGLAVAFIIGFAAQGLIQIPYLVQSGFKFSFKIDWSDSGLRQIGKLALPVLIASWVMPINILVNARAVAPLYGGQFGLNGIYFANTLYVIVSGVFILSLTNVVFPKLSRQASVDDQTGFNETVSETFRVMVYVLLPLTIGMMALSEPLVNFVLGGGQFGERAVDVTSTALFFFAPGIVGYGLLMLLTRVCYAQHDGRTPMISAVVAISINFVLSFVLVNVLSVGGAALAGASGKTVGACILIVALSKRNVFVWNRQLITGLLKMILLTVFMAIAVLLVAGLTVQMHVALQLAIPGLVGIAIYVGMGYLLGMREAFWVLSVFRKK